MFFTIYKITNIKTNEIYIGQHMTENLNDNYMGSGKRLINSINKYGKTFFTKEILYIYDNFDEMNLKEGELVDDEFIKRKDTLNIILGGANNFQNTVVVKLKDDMQNVYFRIHKDKYDKNIHMTPTSNTLLVLSDNGDIQRISSKKYQNNKEYLKTPSTGYKSIYNIESGKTSRIKCEDFNPKKHKSVLGGIVIRKNGTNQYVSKEEFYSQKLEGIHKGKTTVIEKNTGITKHINVEEYHTNRHLYRFLTEGFTTGTHRKTGKKKRFRTIEITDSIKLKYSFSTEGQRTAFSLEEDKFVNINKKDFDRNLHKLASDKMFICYSQNDKMLFKYWGDKKTFFKTYNLPYPFWQSMIRGKRFLTKSKKGTIYNNCYFKVINWKEIKNVQNMWKTM